MRRSAMLCAVLLLSGCKDRGVDDISRTTFAAPLGVELASMTRTPGGVYVKDLVVGMGDPVRNGQQVSIHYVGSLATGQTFDENRPADPPYVFRLGAGEVIAGFDQGVAGMRVGGTRQVVIPPEQGYGPQGNGPIPPNAVLVFVIDVVAAQ